MIHETSVLPAFVLGVMGGSFLMLGVVALFEFYGTSGATVCHTSLYESLASFITKL